MKRLFLISIVLGVFYAGAHGQWVQTSESAGDNIRCFAASGSNLFAGFNTRYDSAGVVLSTDFGISWSNVSAGLPSREIDALVAVGSNLFVAENDAGVYLSTDNGSTWTVTGLTVAYVNSFATIGTNLFTGESYNGVRLSTNNGTSWTLVDSGLTTPSVNALVASGSNLFAATSGGGVFLSTNNGTSWTAVNSGLSSTYGYIDAITVSGTNLFAGSYETGVFRSTNNGTSWTAANSGLPRFDVPYYQVLALATSGTNLFAGTYGGGVYLSTNNGSSWTAVNQGLTHMGIRALVVNGGYLFAGGDSTGVCRRPLSEMTTSVNEYSTDLPTQSTLYQNYPDPFNPTTTILYAVPQRSQVTLTVFNTLGQPVSTLVSGTEEAGFQEVTFNGSNLASGVYFYRLTARPADGGQAGAFVQTRKFCLLR